MQVVGDLVVPPVATMRQLGMASRLVAHLSHQMETNNAGQAGNTGPLIP